MPRELHTKLAHPIFSQPVFNEKDKTIDQAGFQTKFEPDSDIYKQIEKLLTKDVVTFEKSRFADDEVFPLATAYGPDGAKVVEQIQESGTIVFHALGDSGATTAKKYKNEVSVADQVTEDAFTQEVDDRPSLLFHLGDVVYDFGESQYYYDQFYEPYRNYPAPIFAIPGNHDSFIVPGTAKAEDHLE